MCSDLTKKELGIVQAVLERFEKQRLPRLMNMKEKVDQGNTLGSRDISLLDEAIHDASGAASFADKHPEYQTLVAEVSHLYNYITKKALENEKIESVLNNN